MISLAYKPFCKINFQAKTKLYLVKHFISSGIVVFANGFRETWHSMTITIESCTFNVKFQEKLNDT